MAKKQYEKPNPLHLGELEPHRVYIVRGMEMMFFRLRPFDEAPVFYHYATYGNTRHCIYFCDPKLRASEVTESLVPMIKTLTQPVTNPQVINS